MPPITSISVPKRIDDDQYDKLSRRLWEMEQRLSAIERVTCDAVDHDMLFDRLRLIEKMLAKIGVALLGRRKKPEAPPERTAPPGAPAP